MRNNLIAGFVSLALSVSAWPAAAQELRRDILGIHLAMTKEEARKQLESIGTFERDERKGQQIWKVRDESFSHVVIATDKQGRLRFITAVARADAEAKRVPYSAAGGLGTARQAGDPKINNFAYEWSLPASGEEPETMVIARGRDPEFLSTFSLKRLSDTTADGEQD